MTPSDIRYLIGLRKGMPPNVGLNSSHSINHVESLFSYG